MVDLAMPPVVEKTRGVNDLVQLRKLSVRIAFVFLLSMVHQGKWDPPVRLSVCAWEYMVVHGSAW